MIQARGKKSHQEESKKMIERKAKVENENGRDANSHQAKVLVDAKEEDSRCGQGVFHNEELHIFLADKEIHHGIDFLGSLFEMKIVE